MKYVYLMVATMGVTAFAQATSQPTWGDVILTFIASPGGALATALTAIEFGMRLWPTSVAWSLLVPVKYALHVVAASLGFLADSVLQPLIDYKNNTTAPTTLK